MSDLLSLARVFAYLSIVTLGGGMAAYPELKTLAVDVHQWLTFPDLDHLYSVGQMAPGPNMMMIVSIGTLRAGLAGGLVVFLAFFGPTTMITLVVGRVWRRIRERQWVIAIRRGLAPVSVGLLLAGCFTFAKGALTGWATSLIGAAVFAILLRYTINPAILVLFGAAVGVLIFGPW